MTESIRKIKIAFQNEVRLINASNDYEELKSQATSLFSCKLPSDFNFYYVDADGDVINISGQEDYDLAFPEVNKLYISNTIDGLTSSEMFSKDFISNISNREECEESKSTSSELKAHELLEPSRIKNDGERVDGDIEPQIQQDSFTKSIPDNRLLSEALPKCSVCSNANLLGEFFECTVCKNFYMCFGCVNEKGHVHPLEKRKTKRLPIINQKYSIKFHDKNNEVKRIHPYGEKFDVIWIIENDGNCSLPIDSEFRQMNGAFVTAQIWYIGALEPGEFATVKFASTASVMRGKYIQVFNVVYDQTKKIGPSTNLFVKAPKNRELFKLNSSVISPGLGHVLTTQLFQLEELFPMHDTSILQNALEINQNNVERAIEYIFSCCI